MTVDEAIAMLAPDEISFPVHAPWADLGAGTGTFTLALATILAGRNTLCALDKDLEALNSIPDKSSDTVILKAAIDFVKEPILLPPLAVVLMANSLHYVKDKEAFLEKVKGLLTADSRVLLVEYDMGKSNPWVPFPLKAAQAEDLFLEAGFRSFRKLRERPSVYNRAQMYSGVAVH